MNKKRAVECWPTWNGCCEVCGGRIEEHEDVTRDGDFRLCHIACAVDAQDISAAAAALGRKGGKVKTAAKSEAARENGRKGGRPPHRKTEKEKYIAEFKTNQPIFDCLGSTNGRWKWRRIMDCIDLRYGHDTRQSAAIARHKAAVNSWAHKLYDEEIIEAPCGHKAERRVIEAVGMCAACADKKYN